ncbi:MAG: ATP-binding protein, partial [Proteobacteria bacterium]
KAAACTLEIERMEEVLAAVDPLRFEQVVVNLLNNAAKYAPGTKVSLALWQDAGMARLLVEDGGRGIPAEDRERIFERFEQVSSVQTVGGLGLGLFISRQIIAAHGGSLVVGEGKEGGASFSISVPLKSLAAIEPAHSSDPVNLN